VDADCHEEEEVVAVSDWMDCTKLHLEAQHLCYGRQFHCVWYFKKYGQLS